MDKIKNGDDLKRLSQDEVIELASEIREFLVKTVSKTGGHLASNLGVVELTLAIHRVFNLPNDKLIFDVGHQSYVHKLLTGRLDKLSGIRSEGGISGFPKRSESEYDAFDTGHSSTALSAGIGIASAAKLSGSDSYTIVVVGDGAATGGLVYEALNNCRPDLKLIVILNENEMSISKNVGNMSGVISKMRSTSGYFATKDTLSDLIENLPLVGRPMMSVLRKTKKILKTVFYNGYGFIENMGLKYYGPIDGNDLKKTELLLRRAVKYNESALIHLRTTKGKGFPPAEKNPEKYHAVKPENCCVFDKQSFSCAAGSKICALGAENDRLCVITASMREGTCMTSFFDAFPQRSFDVGIAEGHAVTFAAGLAVGGYLPVFAVYSSFLQRSYDNLLHDVSLQNLHIVLLIDRAGLSPDDGATHHGIWDVAFLSHMEGTELYSPISAYELDSCIDEAIGGSGICAVRYPKGCEGAEAEKLFRVGKHTMTDVSPEKLSECDTLVITYGRVFTEALTAANHVREAYGLRVCVAVCEKLLPYSDAVDEICLAFPFGVTKAVLVEEGIKRGGFCVDMQYALSQRKAFSNCSFSILAIDEPPEHGELHKLYERCGISSDFIENAIVVEGKSNDKT